MENKRTPEIYFCTETDSFYYPQNFNLITKDHIDRKRFVPLFTKADLEDAFEQGQNDIGRDGCGSGINAFNDYYKENYEE